MISAFLAAAVLSSCPAVQVINRTDEWTERDQMSVEHARGGCKRIYSEDHCLRRFIKKAPGNYWAICRLERRRG